MIKKPLIILTGPTAVGKTSTSIALAKKLNGEIISADSMQVYKHMDIGSAKIKTEEMSGVPHHLIDILSPEDPFSVAQFQILAKEAVADIYKRGKIPIVVGGTGFYIQALLYDIDFTEKKENTYRQELEAKLDLEGPEALHDFLRTIDEQSAIDIHPNNCKRVIRAIEYYYETGTRISVHNAKEREKDSPYLYTYFVLNDERERLYKRIDERIDIMIEEGLVREVEWLLEQGYHKDLVSMQGLGYKEIVSYLEGENSFDEAIRILKRDTRHFAKRQITWFKREKEVTWVNKNEFNYNQDQIESFLIDTFNERIK